MRLAAVLLCIALCACGRAANDQKEAEQMAAFDVAEPAPAPQEARAPQIAYSYTLSYTLGNDAVVGLQERAAAACRRLGSRRCLLTKSELDRDPGDGNRATLNLLVDARLAPAFNQRLDALSSGAGGSPTGREVTAEDVTKQIVDTAARVRAKQALADRLLGLIHTANGSVADLVAAEKAYAEVQEELDAARSLDAELRQRVAMSAMAITFLSTRDQGTWAPVRRAADGLGSSFAGSVGTLVTFVAAAVPWAVLAAVVLWAMRRLRWRPRWPWRRAGRRDGAASLD